MDSGKIASLKGILAVNVATLSWATNIIIGRYVRDEIGPITLTAARYAVAALVFTLLLRNAPPEERRPDRDLLPLLAMAGVAVLILGSAPAAIGSMRINPGDLVILLAAAIWGLYSVAGRRASQNRSPLSATALSTMMGLPVLVIAALFEQRTIPTMFSSRLVLIVLYVGLVPAALGFSLWIGGALVIGGGLNSAWTSGVRRNPRRQQRAAPADVV